MGGLQPLLTRYMLDLSGFHVIGYHAGRLTAQTESDDVQIVQREYLLLHHVVEQLSRTFGHHRQIVDRVYVAWLRRQWPVIDTDHIELVVLEEGRPNVAVWRKVFVAGVAVDKHDKRTALGVAGVVYSL